jgi:hypothetical protein
VIVVIRLWVAMTCCLFIATQSFAYTLQLGEKLHYKVSYSGLASAYEQWDVADGQFSISPELVNFRGQPVYEFLVKIDTKKYPIADALLKFRYLYRSYVDQAKTQVQFVELIDRVEKLKHEITWFDWDKKQAERFKLRRKKRLKKGLFGKGEKQWVVLKNESIPQWLLDAQPEHEVGVPYFRSAGKGRVAVKDGTLDQLSATYLFREKELKLGETWSFPISTGKEVSNYQLNITAKETIHAAGKDWSTYRVEINTKNLHGVFKRSENTRLTVWISEFQRIPVKFEADVVYGLFSIQLASEY